MTELIDTTFDLLEDQIRYVHAKDFVWNTMLPGINWAMNGTGNMDYEMFLVRLSRLKTNPFVLVEFLTENDEDAQAQRNIRESAKGRRHDSRSPIVKVLLARRSLGEGGRVDHDDTCPDDDGVARAVDGLCRT